MHSTFWTKAKSGLRNRLSQSPLSRIGVKSRSNIMDRQKSKMLKIESLEPRVLLAGDVIISEFLAINSNGLEDEDGDNSDWIEILSVDNEPNNLAGWHLTDDPDELDKWTFPDVTLIAGDNLLVFASNKDRDGAGELHTNFRLLGSGEYLALVRPDNTIASEFNPKFASQVADVSFGIPNQRTTQTLLLSGADATLLIPTDGTLDATTVEEIPPWAVNDFDDSSWTTVTTGVGFEAAPTNAGPGLPVADSELDFSNIQDQDSWNYGYWNKGADADGTYSQDDFTEFLFSGATRISQFNHWDGSKWDFKAKTSRPLTELTPTGGHPAAGPEAADIQHWVIRRYKSEVVSPLRITGTLGNEDASGDGVIGRVLVDGVEVFQQHVNGNSVEYSIPLDAVLGTTIDFVIDAGPGNDDTGDATTFTASIESFSQLPPPDLSGSFATDIQADMLDISSSAYLRVPFTVDDPTAFDSLILRLRYDSGYVAYLNGVEVSRQNVPNLPVFDSVGTVERDDADAIEFESIDITASLGALHAGDNLLAVHGLNIGIGDSDFISLPEIEGRQLEVDTTANRFFLTPTPGEPNGLGATDAGPIIGGVSHSPELPNDGDDIIVTATVVSTDDPVQEVNLYSRLMFAPEEIIEMFDDGAHGDGEAGDGVYGATIPAGRNSRVGQMIRYRIEATDDGRSFTVVPPFEDQLESEQYFGTIYADPTIESNLPVFHRFLENPLAANTGGGARGGLFYDGEFYDNVHFNLHGQSSSGFPTNKKSLNVDFTTDHRFRLADDLPRMKDFNFLTTFADESNIRNTLAYEVYKNAEAPGHLAFAVRVQENGAFHSTMDFVEDGDSFFLRRLGFNPNNSLYKMFNTFSSLGHATSGAEWKTRQEARVPGNEDLVELIENILPVGPATTTYIYDNVNLPAMANYMASYALTSSTDCCHKNYYLYRDTFGTGEWEFFPWDLDLSFGRQWGGFGRAYFDDTTYFSQTLWFGGNNSNNRFLQALKQIPDFSEMMHRRLRTLMDEQFQPPGTPLEERLLENRINELVEQLGEDGANDSLKWQANWGQRGFKTFEEGVDIIRNEYLEQRREFLYGNAAIPDAQPSDAAVSFGEIEFNPESGNQNEEFIEVTNTNSYAVDISGWTLEGEVEHRFKPGTVIPAGGSLYLSPDVRAFRNRSSRGPSGGQNLFIQGDYEGHLSARGGLLKVLDRDGREAGMINYEGDPLPTQDSLRITEIMFNPLGVEDGFDESGFEYIELQNISDAVLDISTVQFREGIQFSFAGSNVTSLDPGEYVLVVKNEAVFASRYDTTNLNIAGEYVGQLDNAGERLLLEELVGETILSFRYNDSWYSAADGSGFSLHIVDATGDVSQWNESEAWRPSRFVDGSPGADDLGGLPDPGSIITNEVLTNTTAAAGDTIELQNTSTEPINIGGWYLSDNVANLRKYQIPADTVIPAGGYAVFNQQDHFGPVANGENGFGLSSFGERVIITAGEVGGDLLGYQEIRTFGAAGLEVPFGLSTNSTGKVEFIALSESTFGSDNAAPLVSPVVINEIMYNPVSGGIEFVELLNTSDQAVPLFDPDNPENTWQFTNGIDFSFPSGAEIPAGGYALITPLLPDDYRSIRAVPDGVLLLGPFDGSLDNNGERLELSRPSLPDPGNDNLVSFILMDHVRYNDKAPWPEKADGDGPSLERTDPTAYGDDVINWERGPAGGSPGSLNIGRDKTPPTVPVNVQAELIIGGQIGVSWNASTDAESGVAFYKVFRDGEEIVNTTDTGFIEDFLPVDLTHVYQVLAVNGDDVESSLSAPTIEPSVETVSLQEGVLPDSSYLGVTDAYLDQSLPTRNFGLPPTVLVDGNVTNGSDISALMRWDLSSIPADSRAISVSLGLHVLDGTSGPYDIFPVLRDWVENEATWLEYSSGNAWASPGAKGATDIGPTVGRIGFTADGDQTIDFSAEGVEMVQSWIDGSSPNYGFLIANTDTSDVFEFASRNWRSGRDRRPILTINLAAPDTTAPEVQQVLVSSSDWDSEFLNHVDPESVGYEIPSDDAQLDPLPWNSLDTISVVFTKDVIVTQADLAVSGVNNPEYATSGFSYDANSRTAQWTLADSVDTDKLLIQLPDTIADNSGNTLADFTFRLNILPGDADQDGEINNREIQLIRDSLLSNVGDASYSALLDFDGNSSLDIRDVQQLRSSLLNTLPIGEPAALQAIEISFVDSAEAFENTLDDDTSYSEFSSDYSSAVSAAASRRDAENEIFAGLVENSNDANIEDSSDSFENSSSDDWESAIDQILEDGMI